jgi:glycosyltransferase involved in cell wall biosynthesis
MILTAALIVKNEEKYLEQCIKSLLPFIPDLEIVILDTGSSDRTVEIAQKYTKHVYHQKWQNNFALHRNKSFSYAKGDWILQIDADEELCFQKNINHETFLKFLDKLPENINAVGMPLKDWRDSQKRYVAEFDVVRIFRRDKVTWTRRIHNEALYDGDAAYFPVGFLKHWGYDLNLEQKKVKAERTITLLLDSIEEDPSDYQSYFYLAQSYSAWLQDDENAVKYAQMYLDFKGFVGKKFNQSIYHLVAAIHIKNENYDEALNWIKLGLEHNQQNIDICYDLMQLGLKQNNGEYIAVGAQKFVVAMENFQKNRLKCSGQFFFSNNATCYCMALHYLTTALFEKASIEYAKLQKMMPQINERMQTEIKNKVKEFTQALGWENVSEKKRIITADSIGHNQILRPGQTAQAQSGLIKASI